MFPKVFLIQDKDEEEKFDYGEEMIEKVKEMKKDLIPEVDKTIVESKEGVKGSFCPFNHDLKDPKADLILANVLYEGATKYSKNNWRGNLDDKSDVYTRNIVSEHLNHAITHINKYLMGSDNDLRNALCRIHFAVAVLFQNKDYIPVAIVDPETKKTEIVEWKV